MFSGERHTVPTISVADPGCLSRVVKIPGSGSASNNLNYFNLKKLFLCFRKYEPVCSSRIPDVVKKAPDPGSVSATLRTVLWSEVSLFAHFLSL